MDSKIIDITNHKSCSKWRLDIKFMILTRYNCQTAKTRALYEFPDGSAVQPTDNSPNSVRLRDFPWTIFQMTVQNHWAPSTSIRKTLCFDVDTNLKQQSRTHANMTYEYEVMSSLSLSPCDNHELIMSTLYTKYCSIPRLTGFCSQPVSPLLSLSRPCCTEFSDLPQLIVNQWR